MEIRKLATAEHGKTRKMYEEIFSEDSKSFVDYYYTEKTKDNTIYVAEEEGELCAMLHLNPYRMVMNGREWESHYIVAVATRPAYRKRGYMARLLARSLRDMYGAGEAFTFLMPAAERIYLPHDFRTVYEQEQRYFPVNASDAVPGCMKGAEDSDCEALAQVANAHLAGSYQVYVRRDRAYYERLLKEYASDGGALMVKKEKGRIIDCQPLVPGETPGEKPKIMVRIVDAERLLGMVKVKQPMNLCFCITDPILTDNNRCVVMSGVAGAFASLTEGRAENSEGTVTVAALASLLFGAESVEEACREEGVSMSEEMQKELKKTEPLERIWLNEIV